jgi:hypothetical protein
VLRTGLHHEFLLKHGLASVEGGEDYKAEIAAEAEADCCTSSWLVESAVTETEAEEERDVVQHDDTQAEDLVAEHSVQAEAQGLAELGDESKQGTLAYSDAVGAECWAEQPTWCQSYETLDGREALS